MGMESYDVFREERVKVSGGDPQILGILKGNGTLKYPRLERGEIRTGQRTSKEGKARKKKTPEDE